MRTCNPIYLALLGLAILCASAPAADLLPRDPAIESGTFENGVTWMYRQHDNPPGKMALMLHIRTGSLYETEAQRGLAHFMEHMMFNGTENFPPGELIPYFESLGMEFGADVNAMTTFDQTVYMLYTPDTETAQVDKALLALSDYAFRALLLEDEIEQERGVILEELRSGMSAQERVSDKLWPRLFAGSRFAERLVIGLEEVIKKAPREEFMDYYRTWYRPERMTVMLVGDAALEKMLPLMEKNFGQFESSVPARKGYGPEFKLFNEQRAIIITDPELASLRLEMMKLLPGRPATTTLAQLRTDMKESLGDWIVNRRYNEKNMKGEATYQSAGAGVFSFFGDALLASVSGEGDPKDWEKVLEEVIVELSRAREHGFTEHELGLAKTEFLSSAEWQVNKESTRQANSFLMEMMRGVQSREILYSAAQFLDAVKELLPTITLEEVNQSFADHFAPGNFAYVLTLPEKEGVAVPREEELLAAARAALALKTEAPQQEERGKTLLAELPEPGKTVEKELDEDLAITHAWLANGVRVHHRYMDEKKDSVWVSISLAGGVIEETVEQAGITSAAALAFAQPATGTLSSTEIQDLMTGKNIAVSAEPDMDSLMVSVTGSPADLEHGLQLAHVLIRDARIEDSIFNIWKPSMAQQLEAMENEVQFKAYMNMLGTTSGRDHRVMFMTREQLDRLTLPAAQAWLDRILAGAPIEVAVVGDISYEDAMPLIERYVGSLSPRARKADHLDGLRKVKSGAGPWKSMTDLDTITPKGMAFFGFMGCDRKEVMEIRALNLASQVLSSHLIKRIREELTLVYSINAMFQSLPAFDDYSLFVAGAPCDPDKVSTLIEEGRAVFMAFAEKGPTEEELENAKKQIVNNMDETMKQPTFWWSILQHLDLHEWDLNNQKDKREKYLSFTAEQIRDVFRKYYQPDRFITVGVTPVQAEEDVAVPVPVPVEEDR